MDLELKYGYAITYEDPRYVYQGDLQNATKRRRDLYRWPPGKAPKTFVPLGGSLTLTLPSRAQIDESTMYDLLGQLVGSWSNSNQGGSHFAVEEEDRVFHIVPTEVRDLNGNWRSVESILAKTISIPSQPRTEEETFKAIGYAIGTASGVKVATALNSGFIVGPPQAKRYTFGAQDEAAGSVLMRAIEVMGKKRSWYLWYDPMARDYLLNIYDVTSSPSQAGAAKSTPNAAPPGRASASCGPTAAVCPP